MNTGQMMLTLGAMLLLSFLILRVNSTQLLSQETITDSKLGIVALTIANSYMDFAKRRVFDTVIADSIFNDPTVAMCTAPNALGPEIGENYPNFDDIDDFNLWDPALSRFITVPDTTTLSSATDPNLFTEFFVTSSVYYVPESDFETKANIRTLFKRIDVRVWTEQMKDTLVYSSIATIW
ncbi:MAG: hypothetical protein IPH97_03915 [Ignavibacteriales bacterium]|nr:hypothetical protein [Ignavibacteriales bacterium]